MKVDLTPAELRALVHALNMRVAVFNERLQEVGGRVGGWRVVRGYVEADCALRDKLRGFIAEDDEMQRKLRAVAASPALPKRD
jgi:hypothetical protein